MGYTLRPNVAASCLWFANPTPHGKLIIDKYLGLQFGIGYNVVPFLSCIIARHPQGGRRWPPRELALIILSEKLPLICYWARLWSGPVVRHESGSMDVPSKLELSHFWPVRSEIERKNVRCHLFRRTGLGPPFHSRWGGRNPLGSFYISEISHFVRWQQGA